MVVFERESVGKVLRAGKELFAAHYAENTSDPREPLDLHEMQYFMAEEMGMLRVFSVRDEGILVGYACVIVQYNWKHRLNLEGIVDALFVHQTYRRSEGVRFIRFVEEALREEGVRTIRQHARPDSHYEKILSLTGYDRVYCDYEKRLE